MLFDSYNCKIYLPALDIDAMGTRQRLGLDGSKKITFQAKNPKRKNTASFARYSQYCQAQTVDEALQLGARPCDLDHDYQRGYLESQAGCISVLLLLICSLQRFASFSSNFKQSC